MAWPNPTDHFSSNPFEWQHEAPSWLTFAPSVPMPKGAEGWHNKLLLDVLWSLPPAERIKTAFVSKHVLPYILRSIRVLPANPPCSNHDADTLRVEILIESCERAGTGNCTNNSTDR